MNLPLNSIAMAFQSSTDRRAPARAWFGALLVAGASLTPALASAEPDDGSELLREGVEQRRAGRDAEALATFRRARAASPSPRVDAQIGLAEQALSMWLESEEDLGRALGAADDPWIRRNRDALERTKRLVATKLGWLVIRSNVEGAEILVGGRAVGSLSAETARRRVVAGPTTIELRADGYRPASQSLLVVPETETAVKIELTKSTDPPPAPRDTARPAPAQPSSRRTIGWVVLGAGAVGLGAGAAFGLRALSLKNERDADCEGGCTQTGVDADREGRSAGLAATIATVAGAVGVGAGLILVLSAPRDVRVSFGPGTVTAGARF